MCRVRFWLACVGCCAIASIAAAPAAAVAIGLVVDPIPTAVSAEISAPYPGDAQPIDVSGSASGDFFFAVDPVYGLYAPVVQATGAALAFSDASFVLDAPAGITLSVDGSGVGASLTSPALFGFAVAPGTALIDFGDSVLSLDAGTLTGTGTEFGNPIQFLVDLALTPLQFVLPLNTSAEVFVQPLGGGLVDIVLTLPLDVAATVFPSGIETTFELSGQIVVTGTASVPEPSTGLLVCGGLLALGDRRRRERRGRRGQR